jgi:hypothetical protein
MDYSVKPIKKWPGKLTVGTERKRAPFKTTYAKTLAKLDRELRHLSADHVIIQLALRFEDIRMDGRPYADAKVQHPGAIVTFQSEHGPLSYWTDKYEDWHANVHAISLALEALRAVGRHGVNQEDSQYTGYKQLPANASPDATGTGIFTEDDAARFLGEHSEVGAKFILEDRAIFELAYGKAQKKCHPDAGGSDSLFVTLQEAAALLRKRHGL